MSRGIILALGVVIVASSSPTGARESGPSHRDPAPPECAVAPAPSQEAMAPYGRRGLYARGVRQFARGRPSEAARDLARAWQRVRADLGKVFQSSSCEPERIRAVLAKTLFHAPPLAVPGDDRFLPPPAIRDALAHALCVQGRTREAAEVLIEAAWAGDEEARTTAAALFAASGSPDICLSLLPENPLAPVQALARAYCLAVAGRIGDAASLASGASRARGPRAEALRALLRAAGLALPSGVPTPEDP